MEEEERKIRIAVIAGASRAARFKEENPNATEDQVVQHVTENVTNIISKIDTEF